MIEAAHTPSRHGVSSGTDGASPIAVSASMSLAIAALVEASRLASDVERSRWDFAVELEELTRLGVSNNTVRWLACKGYVNLAMETTLPGAEERTFRSQSSTCLTACTCVAISKIGRRFAEDWQRSGQIPENPLHGEEESSTRPDIATQPTWDCERAELRLGRVLIKQFRKSAPVQKLILTVFEEEGWPPRIDDPLPQAAAKDPQRRLLDAIKTLNQGHQRRVIRFCGDGTGRGVKWEFVQGAEVARRAD